MATQGQGGHLRDILSAELRPYEVSRVSMEGPHVLLLPKLVLALQRLEDEEKFRKLAVDELAHRLKNKKITQNYPDRGGNQTKEEAHCITSIRCSPCVNS
jgi:hypothetical protein